MARAVIVASLLAVAVIVLLSCVAGVADATAKKAEKIPTEADFKKMKMKAIKEWMEDRGVKCDDCQEKDDFVRICVKNADKPVLSGRVKPVASGPFWETWHMIAYDICAEVAKKQGTPEEDAGKVCNAIKMATDGVFMQHGKRTANKLKKKPDALTKTSLMDTYYKAGRRMFAGVAKHCLSATNIGNCKSSSTVQSLLEKKDKVKGVDVLTWITNVGIENTNPMYDILKDKNLRDEL